MQAGFMQIWSRFVRLLAVLAIALLAGCSQPIPPVAKPQSDDRAEILARHLLRRVNDSEREVTRLQGELIDRENLWLKADIAELEGRLRPKHPPLKGQRPPSEVLTDGIGRLSQSYLDAEELIELHNRNHPESPYDATKWPNLREWCGDCAAELAIRNQQLKEEAPMTIYTPVISQPKVPNSPSRN